MIRRSNTASGVYLLRRAATLAKGIRAKFGKRTEVHDGCLVEGRRSGGRLFATVIEPPGGVALVGPYDGMVLARVGAPAREFFSPSYPLQEPRAGLFGERQPFSGYLFSLGPPVPTGAASLAVGHAHVGARAVYYPAALYTGELTTAGLASAEVWLRVLITGTGASPTPRSFSIHQSVVQAAAPGYDLIPRNVATATEWGSLPIATVCELDGLVIVAVQVAKGRTGTIDLPKVTQGVVVLALDLATRQVVWTAFQSAEAMPSGFVPQELGTNEGSTWAQSAFYHLTAAPRQDGSVQVVGFYQVDRQDQTSDGGPAIVPIMAVADLTFSPGVASAYMVHADVRAPASSPIVAELGADPGFVLRPLLPHVVDNKIAVEAYRYKRAPNWGYDPSGPDFDLEPPFSHVFFDGTQVSTASTLGSMEVRQPAVSSDIGVILNPNQLTDKVGAGTVAYKGRELEGRGLGVTFVKAGAAKFEQLVAEWSGTIIGELISVSCPQQEVRDSDGLLLVPCVVITLFSAGANDDTFIGVRKGPVWPEDGAVADHMQYWRKYPIDTWAQLGAVYTGNPLTLADHGRMFEVGT